MVNASYHQANFQGGEWSPSMQGRVDDPRYKIALAQCLNYIPTTEGSLKPRSGFRRMGITSFARNAVMLPFRFSATEAYVLEFGTVMRLWANGLLIIQDTMTIASVSTGGTPTFTMSTNFPTLWTTYTNPTIKIHFSTIDAMEKAPFLCNREFLLNITGANTCTLTDVLTAAPLTTPIATTFTARMDLIYNGVSPGAVGDLEVPDTEDVRILAYTSQKLLEGGLFASAVEHRASVITPQIPPIAFSSTRGVTNPIYEQFVDGPYLDSLGDTIPAFVSGTSGDITVTLNGYGSTIAYNTGDLSYDSGSGNVFVSLIDNNVGNAFPAVADAHWALVPIAWNSGTTYAIGSPSTGDPTVFGVPTVYYSLAAGNTNHALTDATKWSTTPPTYAGGTSYVVGAVVVSSAIQYVCIQAGSGHTPASSPTFWLPVNFTTAVGGTNSTLNGHPAQNRFASTDASDSAPSTSTTFGLAGRLMRLKVGPQPWNIKTTYGSGAIVNFNDVIFKSLSSSNTGNQPDQDATHWAIQTTTIQWTWGMIKTYVSPYQAVVTILGDPLLNSNPIWEYRLGVYSDTTGWPSCCCYHEGRVILASFTETRESADTLSIVRSLGVPNRIDFGQPDQGFSFAPTAPDGTVSDGNGIALVLNAAGNEHVQSLASSVDGIIAFTDMGEWIIAASNLNDPITPTSVQAKRGTTFTSAQAGSVPLTSSHAFIQGNRRRLLEYKQFVDMTAYQVRPNAADLTKDCQHLTLAGIGHVDFQRAPQPVIWCTTGQKEAFCHRSTYKHELFGIGYARGPDQTYVAPFSVEHGVDLVNGFITDFHSIAVQYGADNTKEYLYTDHGGWVEMLEPVLDTSGPSGALTFLYIPDDLSDTEQMLADGCFLDSAIAPVGFKGFPGKDGVTFYGMMPFANQTVSFCIRGKYIGDYLVNADGSVDVPYTNGASTTFNADGNFSAYDTGQAMTRANSSLTLPDYYQEFLYDNNGNNDFGPNVDVLITRYCAYFGYKYRRRGKMLRPQIGSQNGPSTFAKTMRNHRMGVYVDSAHEISIGTDFTDLSPLTLTVSGPKDVSPLQIADMTKTVTTGIFRDNVKDDYSFDAQLCWEQTEPYPGSILGVGGFDSTGDV